MQHFQHRLLVAHGGRFLAQAGGVGLAAWLLIYLGLEFGILRRVSRMHGEIAAIGPGSVRQRIGDRGNDELGRLALEINRMLERLEQSETRDREILDAIQDGYFELSPDGIVRAVWLSLDELRATRERHRSPLILQCCEDYLAGRRFPLDLLRHYDA